MPRKPVAPEKLPPSSLLESRDTARDKLQVQIEKGKEIRNRSMRTNAELERTRAEHSKWSKYNTEMLTRLFDNSSMADEYNYSSGIGFISFDPSLEEQIEDFQRDVANDINKLDAIRDRLDLIPESIKVEVPITSNSEIKGNHVFLVHGHDDAAKEAVARYMEKLDLKVLILHEQPNAGKTIIEKFENYANVGFAVVLLTPDDVMDKSSSGKARARQNVVFEFGYFIGRLGRKYVCALLKEGVEKPSDIDGVLYIPMDTAGAWRLLLARELKQAGLPVDLNKAV